MLLHTDNHSHAALLQCQSQRLTLADFPPLVSTGWCQHFTKCQKEGAGKADPAAACCGWLGCYLAGKSFPEGFPWQTSLCLADESSAIDSHGILQPVQPKSFESFQRCRCCKRQTDVGCVAPYSISNRSVEFRGTTGIHAVGSEG